ncbi:MAG: Zn-ribbon domain-containing OB-fold protein [Anaerolineae bacterium]|nr:Zn-ribbon domain-containing OB-fold protein [Anaerolineae bacterium]
MAEVTSRKDIQTVSSGDGDPWAAFRQIERLTLSLTQHYTHTLGKYSRFFIELEQKRFLATRCESCGRVCAPPRPLCPNCLQPTHWVELTGAGTVETYSVLHFSPGSNADVAALTTPYVLAYVLLDGASTLFPHLLRAEPEQVTIGMRVRIAYVDGPVEHPIHLMHFIPME